MHKFNRRFFILSIIAVTFIVSLYFEARLIVATFTNAKTTNQPPTLPIYCVKTDKAQVSLSFDGAWGNDDTNKILEILEKHNIRATFFLTGDWISAYPEDVRFIASKGHDLANHSENHKHMSNLTSSEIEQEIMVVHNKVKEITGIDMDLFRMPYGDYNKSVVSCVYAADYFPIQWSVDSLDWKNYGRDNLINTVLNHKNLKNGAIILMHNGGKYTASALDAIITGLINKGYEIVPVSELIYRENFTIDHTGMQIKE